MARPKSDFLKVFGKAWEVFQEKPKAESEHFTSIMDVEVPPRHQATLAKYRRLATEWGVPDTVAVCYRVRVGFTIREHAPKFGPCHQGFSYLQGWNFPDEPTKDCLVFWIPRLVPGSTNKTRNDQLQLLGEIRMRLELPAHHLTDFGKVALDAGLILAHFKATQERVPIQNCWIRTDTCGTGGYRLNLGVFDSGGLYCNGWGFDEEPFSFLGVFALGVEELGS